MLDLLALTPFAAVLTGITLTANFDIEVALFSYPAMIILPFALLSSLSLLVILVALTKLEILEQERHLAGLNESYYYQPEKQQEQLRQLGHDIANHLQTIASMEEDRTPYFATA